MDANVQLKIVQTLEWPIGLAHIYQYVNKWSMADPFNYDFLERLDRDYQDLSDDTRTRVIYYELIQQLYRFNTPEFLKLHTRVKLEQMKKLSDIQMLETKVFCTNLNRKVEEFKTVYLSGHDKRLMLVNSQLIGWPLSRLDKIEPPPTFTRFISDSEWSYLCYF